MAVAYMLAAVVGFSFIPLVIDIGGGAQSPFLFNTAWRLGVVAGCLCFLGIGHWSLLFDRQIAALSWRRIFSWTMLFAVFGNFQFAIFTWSTRFIDIALAAVLLETWPIFLILLTGWLFKVDNRFRRPDYTVYILVAMGFVGFVFAVASQSTSLMTLWSVNNLSILTVAIGAVLAVFAAWAGALEAAFNFRWGSSLSQELVILGRLEKVNPRVDLFSVVFAFAIASTISTPIHAAAGLLTGESITLGVFMTAVGIGGFVQAMSSISYRASILRTDNLGINAMGYAIPILSLFWLALFSLVNVDRVDYLIIGAAAIIIANLLINFEAEIQLGFKSMILALWACGAVVYMRPDEWVWLDSQGYFGVLGLSATLFTLILAFRVSRYVDRTSYEDNTMYSIFHALDLLVRRGVVASQVRENMMSLDAARNIEDTYAAYGDIKLNLQSAQSTAKTPDDQQTLSQTEASLDSVIHSKQRGNNFGEFFALIIFAVITVSIALLARPEQSGWTGFLVEMFTFPFCAVIVFLTVNAWDVHRDWLAAVFSLHPESGWYGVLIRDEASREFEQWISVVIGLAVTVTYAFLLWDKWLG